MALNAFSVSLLARFIVRLHANMVDFLARLGSDNLTNQDLERNAYGFQRLADLVDTNQNLSNVIDMNEVKSAMNLGSSQAHSGPGQDAE